MISGFLIVSFIIYTVHISLHVSLCSHSTLILILLDRLVYFSCSHSTLILILLDRLVASSIFSSQNTISSHRGAAQSRDTRGRFLSPSSRASPVPSSVSAPEPS